MGKQHQTTTTTTDPPTATVETPSSDAPGTITDDVDAPPVAETNDSTPFVDDVCYLFDPTRPGEYIYTGEDSGSRQFELVATAADADGTHSISGIPCVLIDETSTGIPVAAPMLPETGSEAVIVGGLGGGLVLAGLAALGVARLSRRGTS